MELIQAYLDKVESVQGVYFLRVPWNTDIEDIRLISDIWVEKFPGRELIIFPEEFKLDYLEYFSFYIAMMLIRSGKKITRKDWIKEAGNDKTRAPYIYLSEDGDLIVVDGKTSSLFIINQEDLDYEEYTLL